MQAVRNRLLVHLFSMLVIVNASAVEPAPSKLTVRATSSLSDEAIAFIADIAEPLKRTIPPRTRPETFLSGVCGGGLTNTYLKKFQELNPKTQLAPSDSSREVMVPACVHWRNNVDIKISKDDTLDRVILREIGATATTLLQPCGPAEKSSRCNLSIQDVVRKMNPGLDIENLKPGQRLSLPVVSKFTTIKLKQTERTLANVVETLTSLTGGGDVSAAGQGLVSATPAIEDIELVKPLSLDSDKIGASNCKNADAVSPNSWPVDADRLIVALIRNRQLIERNTGQLIRAARVAIIDTGLAILSERLPQSLFDKNMGESEFPSNGIDDDKNGYIDDLYGIDTRGGGKIEPHEGYQFKRHGYYVFDLSTGGAAFRKKYPKLDQHMRFKVIRVVTAIGDRFEIQESAILRAAQYAARNMNIANLSVGSGTSMDILEGIVRNQPKLLLVVAAGNEGQNINLKATYPAIFGGNLGRLSDQVITVAAHAADGQRATFSNFAAEYVDIAAPGCAILQIDENNNSIKNYGTSMAAPLVSFTAALLHSLGMEEPRELKNRIVASAKYVEGLSGAVFAAGQLDPVRAVSLYEDVVENEAGQLAHGRWIRPSYVKLCAGMDELNASLVRKVTVLGAEEPTLRILYQNPDHRLFAFPPCKAEGIGIAFAAADGTEVSIPWKRMNDLVTGTRLIQSAPVTR